MAILKGLESAFSIIIMISIGFYLTHIKWFDEKSSKLLARLVTGVSVPAYMVSNIVTNFDKDKLSSAGVGLVVPFLSMLITLLIGASAANLLKINPKRRGIFRSMFFVSNTIFIGLPVNLALFGETSVPYVLMYYIVNTVFFWTIGVYGISSDGSGTKVQLFSLENIKRIFSPPLLGFLVGIFFVLLNIKPPFFVMDACKYLGNLTTPLSMLFIGTTIYSIDLKKIRPSLDMAVIFIGRFLIAPMIVVLLSYFFPMPHLMKQVFIMQASMPVMTQTAIISKAYNADYEFAAVMVTLTTIASLLFIPIYMAFI